MADYHKRFNFLGEMFPNQFRSIPSIIIWTLVFIVDVALVIWVCWQFGLNPLSMRNSRLLVIIYLVIAFLLFCLESFIYNRLKH